MNLKRAYLSDINLILYINLLSNIKNVIIGYNNSVLTQKPINQYPRSVDRSIRNRDADLPVIPT
jgi:hypothetical protein